MDKIETTIKSICAHNRAVTFYVFNIDLPSEWFQLMEGDLEPLASKSSMSRLVIKGLRKGIVYHYLISYTFLSSLFTQFVSEDLALYLNSDIIVRSNLDQLF